MNQPDINTLAKHYSAILQELGADLDSEGMRETPMRAGKALVKMTEGSRMETDALTKMFKAECKEAICHDIVIPQPLKGAAVGGLEIQPASALVAGRGHPASPSGLRVPVALDLQRMAARQDTDSVSIGIGHEYADIRVSMEQRAPVRFTCFWTTERRWEQRDFQVGVNEPGKGEPLS